MNKINNPYELLQWMDNIKYGYVNKDFKICFDDSMKNYILQTPYDVYKNKVGVCWDQTFFEKYIFDNILHIKNYIFYIEQINSLSCTHTFLVYKYNNCFYYFEHSYENYKGIYKFKTIKEILNFVLKHMKEDNSDNGFIITQIIDIPPYHGNTIDFMNFCVNQKFIYKKERKMRLKKHNMKIFLGGTCAESTWRDELIPLLNIDYFDPRVKDWNEEVQKQEVYEREHCDYCLYVITPRMQGVYSIAEVVQDSNKRPEKTIFCIIEKDGEYSFSESELKSLKQVKKMVKNNGAQVCSSLIDIAKYVNEKERI